MNLRKFLLGIIALAAIAAIGAVYFLPSLIEGQISSELSGRMSGGDAAAPVSVNIETSPQYMLLAGRVDSMDASAQNVRLGDVTLDELHLTGSGLDISVEDLLLARRLTLESADSLAVTGTVGEAALAHLLNEKVSGVSDIAVQINPDAVNATGKIKLFGQSLDLHVKGRVFIEGQQLMLRISDFDTSGGRFGRIGISFTKNIQIADASSLPISNARFTKAEQQNGRLLIEAQADAVNK